MKTMKSSRTTLPAWKALVAHYKKIRLVHLREMFAADPKRGERMTVEAVGLFLDYSKNRVTDQSIQLLLKLMRGDHIRSTHITLATELVVRQSTRAR